MKRKLEEQDSMEEMALGASEEFFQDQILLLPEIMSLILEQLDFRSLMNCRLVCKRWLQEVQSHAVRRTVIRFRRKGCVARIKTFNELRQNHLRGPFPQPFQALDVSLYSSRKSHPYKLFLGQLRATTLLHPPLALTRFSPANVPLEHALPVIIHASSTLEHLKLHAINYEAKYLPQMNPEQTFPKLRHVNVCIADYLRTRDTEGGVNHFASIVTWIVNASPKLETWESRWGISAVELGSQLLLGFSAGVTNKMKSLALSNYKLTRAASEHFLSLPLSQLEHLKLNNIRSEISQEWDYPAVVGTVKKCVDTLKKLDLEIYFPNTDLRPITFPECRNVEELTLDRWDNWKRVVYDSFPALRILNAGWVDVGSLGGSWNDFPPFIGIKTLRAMCYTERGHKDELAMRFLEKFPAVERMCLDTETLLGCCRLTATGDQRYSNIFQCLRHLELDGFHLSSRQSLSLLRVLRGIATLTLLGLSRQLFWIPIQNMPSLKSIAFPWSNDLDLERLQEMAEGIEQVFVSNCCSYSKYEDPQSQNLMSRFLKSASNVQCGCKKSGW